MSTALTLLLACAVSAAFVGLAIPARAGSGTGQFVLFLATVVLAIGALLLLPIALVISTGHWYGPCSRDTGAVGWWSVQRAGGAALSILAAGSSALSVWFSITKRYVAATVAAAATVAFVTGWIFAAQGINIC